MPLTFHLDHTHPQVLLATAGPHNVTVTRLHYHARSYAYGYHGSGPADLALTILNHLWPADGQITDVPVHGGRVRQEVWRLHQAFKRTFIAPLAQEEAHDLEAAPMREWLKAALANLTPSTEMTGQSS